LSASSTGPAYAAGETNSSARRNGARRFMPPP
jgi:hypothetical protein